MKKNKAKARKNANPKTIDLMGSKKKLEMMLKKINEGNDEKVSASRFIRQLINAEFEKHKDLN